MDGLTKLQIRISRAEFNTLQYLAMLEKRPPREIASRLVQNGLAQQSIPPINDNTGAVRQDNHAGAVETVPSAA
jgi:hypothetical protein